MNLQILAVLLDHIGKGFGLQAFDRHTSLLRVCIRARQEQLLACGVLQTEAEGAILIAEVHKAGFANLGLRLGGRHGQRITQANRRLQFVNKGGCMSTCLASTHLQQFFNVLRASHQAFITLAHRGDHGFQHLMQRLFGLTPSHTFDQLLTESLGLLGSGERLVQGRQMRTVRVFRFAWAFGVRHDTGNR